MKKISNIIWGVIGFIVVGYFCYKVVIRAVSDYLLKDNTVHTKAVIIDEKNYYPHSHVTHDFTYSYMFIINGKAYKNNSHNSETKIGDSIEIEYAKCCPSFNRALRTTD